MFYLLISPVLGAKYLQRNAAGAVPVPARAPPGAAWAPELGDPRPVGAGACAADSVCCYCGE